MNDKLHVPVAAAAVDRAGAGEIAAGLGVTITSVRCPLAMSARMPSPFTVRPCRTSSGEEHQFDVLALLQGDRRQRKIISSGMDHDRLRCCLCGRGWLGFGPGNRSPKANISKVRAKTRRRRIPAGTVCFVCIGTGFSFLDVGCKAAKSPVSSVARYLNARCHSTTTVSVNVPD